MKNAVDTTTGRLVSGDDLPRGRYLKGQYYCPKCFHHTYHRASHFQHYNYNANCPDSMKGREPSVQADVAWQAFPSNLNAWLLLVKTQILRSGLSLDEALDQYPPPGEYWHLPWNTLDFFNTISSHGENKEVVGDAKVVNDILACQDDEELSLLIVADDMKHARLRAFENARELFPLPLRQLPRLACRNQNIARHAWFKRLQRDSFLLAVRDDTFYEPVHVCTDQVSPEETVLFLGSRNAFEANIGWLRQCRDLNEEFMEYPPGKWANDGAEPTVPENWGAVTLKISKNPTAFPLWLRMDTIVLSGGLKLGRMVYMLGAAPSVRHISNLRVNWFGLHDGKRFKPIVEDDCSLSPENFHSSGRYFLWTDDERGGIHIEIRHPAQTPTCFQEADHGWIWEEGWPYPARKPNAALCHVFGAWLVHASNAGHYQKDENALYGKPNSLSAFLPFVRAARRTAINDEPGISGLCRHITAVINEKARRRRHG